MLLAAGIGLGGCVAQDRHDALLDANRSLTDRNNELATSVKQLETENQLLQNQRSANERALAELNRQNAAMKALLDKTGMSMKELEAKMRGLTMTALDEATSNALSALAEQYPDLIKFDSARGMLRFASDLTFASGSDAVQEGAKASLAALAKVLTSTPAAAQYELMIMGHTDAQKISAATAQRHPTNVHLSAHRAIAVRSALSSMGVPSDKMFVAGWGEFRPVAANGPKGESPANRRVEIYLTRATSPSMGENTEPEMAKPTKASASKEKPPTRQPDLTK